MNKNGESNGLLSGWGDLDGAEQILRARTDAGDEWAARRLAELLAQRGDLDELRARADTGDRDAATELAELLEECGDLDGALQILRVRAERTFARAPFALSARGTICTSRLWETKSQ